MNFQNNYPLPELEITIPLKGEMFSYQKPGTAYILKHKRVIVGDQMGLGKTLQAIAAIKGANAIPCLVICPSSLKLNWEREISMWTDLKPIILSDSMVNTWPLFFQAGISNVFIVNYESLSKYFVSEMPTKKGWRLADVRFKSTINLFKAVVIDEGHRCFPPNTMISTNKGVISIGDIAKNNIKDILVTSFDIDTNTIVYKRILNIWTNEVGQRRLFRIKHTRGELYATEGHKVYTNAGRLEEIQEIKSGSYLYLLRKDILNKESGENYSDILFKKLCFNFGKFSSRCNTETQRLTSGYFSREEVCLLRGVIYSQISRKEICKDSFLQSKLFCKMESKTTGNNIVQQIRAKNRKITCFYYKANARPCAKEDAFRQDEIKQSNAYARYYRESISKIKGSCIQKQRRERTTYHTSTVTLERAKLAGKCARVSNSNEFCKTLIPTHSRLLQVRHRNTGYFSFDRSRRNVSRHNKSKGTRQIENRGIELVRVESCEVYEQGNSRELANGYWNNTPVYDLEIETTHNYFADGILVSNCKDPKAKQSKLVRGITYGKEYQILLTGTPVINTPVDLASQLAIINQIDKFGGYSHFVKYYDTKDESKLEELKHLLFSTCYYRREKSEVTDLPEKTRQVILCDLTNQEEYDAAERDLAEYLREYKNESEHDIKRKMRSAAMVRIGILKSISAKGKIEAVTEFIKDTLANGEKLIVFGHLREVLGELKHRFPGSVSVTGKDSTADRQDNVDKFQKDDKTRLIFCSIAAAGVGITLTASSTVAFIEMGWHPAIMDQAEDRAHRIGQKNAVSCPYFIGKGTIDNWVYRVIEEKRQVANTVYGTDEEMEVEVVHGVMNFLKTKYNL